MLTKLSIIEYPQIKIKDPRLPVINVGSRDNPSYLPADVCLVLPGQQSNSKLTPQQTQLMIRFAVRKPNQNAQSIVTSGPQLLGFDPNNPTLVCPVFEEYVLKEGF
jgi:eukaryotic translation initiation factor 2C